MKIVDIINLIYEELKLKQQESWDNSGLQIGSMYIDVKNILLALDIDIDTVNYAIDENIDLIITHHPFLFNNIKSIDFDTYDGKLIKSLTLNDINVYSMHTSLDMAELGVNYSFAQKLAIKEFDILHHINDDNSGYGGISTIKPINIVEYARFVKESLGCEYLKLYCNDQKLNVNKVAFCGGSGSDFIDDAIINKAGVYITGDIKYHQAQYALKNNLSIIDAGHYYTESHSLQIVKDLLDKTKDIKTHILQKNSVNEIIL